MCNLDEEKEDNVNSNCSENDQQWHRRGGGGCMQKHGGHQEEFKWWEECKGGGQGRERSKEGGMKAESGVHEKAEASCIAAQQQIDDFQK